MAQNLWDGVLAPSRAIDWSHVGATIDDTRTQCVTALCNTVAGGNVTAASINAALASAPPNTYVSVPAGTFTMSAAITFANRSYETLRGAGSNRTFLVFTSMSASGNCNGHAICASSSDTNYAGQPSNSATWTSGYAKGSTSITLSSTSNLKVGGQLILDQIDDQSDNGALYVGCERPDGSSACYSGTAPSGYQRGAGSKSTIRGQQQVVNVTSISGNTVVITPGLYASNWASSHSPGAWWATNPVFADAVENLSVDLSRGGGNGTTFFNCTGCWVSGVRSITTGTGGTGWYHVGFSICNHCTVRDSYHFGGHGDDYGFAVYIGSDILIENNIGQFPAESMFLNSDCEGCVSTYNFSVNPLFDNSSNWLSQPNYFHSIALFTLAEGNIEAGLLEDSFHGTHVLNTQFRNRWDGREQNNGNATSGNTVGLRLNPGARYNNAIGNVFGTPGYHTNYKATPSGGSLNVSTISCGVYPEAGVTDNLSCTTSMYWGNWDSVTNATRWNANEVPSSLSSYANPVPASQNLPDSFIYSAKPSWWPSSKPWPSVGPDITGGNVGQCKGGTYDSSQATSSSQCSGGTFTPVAGGMVISNPAMDCYLSVMHGSTNGTGSALAFDSTLCYGGSTPPPPTINITIAPTAVTLETSAVQQFTATVTGTTNTAASWNATCGAVSQTGAYLAPATDPGMACIVSATSVADPSKIANATVTISVVPPPPDGQKVISLDFQGTATAMVTSETAGIVPKKFWNEAAGASGTMALVDETGAGTNARATWTSPNGWSTPITSSAGNYKMMKGYLDANNNQSAVVTITGLPTGTYDIYVYTDGDNGQASRTYIYSAPANPDTSIVDSPGSNYAGTLTLNKFYLKDTITGTSFTITARPGATSDGTPRAAINGIQIVPIMVVPPEPPPVSVSIAPSSATILAGGSQQFTATVLNTTNQTVVWSATGGSVDASGLFTSDGVPGSAVVTATSVADTTKSASANVTVNAPPPTLGLTCTGLVCTFTPANIPSDTVLNVSGTAAGVTANTVTTIP
jgi:hypothetical protein